MKIWDKFAYAWNKKKKDAVKAISLNTENNSTKTVVVLTLINKKHAFRLHLKSRKNLFNRIFHLMYFTKIVPICVILITQWIMGHISYE